MSSFMPICSSLKVHSQYSCAFCVCVKLQHCVYGMLHETQRMGIEPILCVYVKLQTKTHSVNGP